MMLDIMAIPLTKNLYALIDGDDYERLNQHKWFAIKGGYRHYAARALPRNKQKQKQILMHREIMAVLPDMQIDHINRNGLDNRKINLRICTATQNQQNKISHRGSSSKYKGISWDKNLQKWRVIITWQGKQIHLGYFNNEVNAAKAYDKAAKQYFGEFANVNF